MLRHSKILQVGWGPIYLLKQAITRILQNVYSPPIFFGHSAQHAGSQFPDQGLNPYSCSEITEF